MDSSVSYVESYPVALCKSLHALVYAFLYSCNNELRFALYAYA